MRDDFSKVLKAKETVFRQKMRDATPYEIYLEIKRAAEANDTEPPSFAKVGRALKLLSAYTDSFEGEDNQDEDFKLSPADYLSKPAMQGEKLLETKEKLKTTESALQRIEAWVDSQKPRTATILTLRLGLHGKSQRTLEEVGERYKLTRERIRQIEKAGLEKLAETLGFTKSDIEELIRIAEELRSLIVATT